MLPQASSQVVRALNNRGESAAGAGGEGVAHGAFILSRTGTRRIEGLRGSDYSIARGINDSGEVVGSSNTAVSVMAFRWTARTGAQPLAPLPGDGASEAFAVNEQGQAVGYSSGRRGQRAVVWSRTGAAQELAVPAAWSRAYSINKAGDIAGTLGKAPARRAFLRAAGGTVQELGVLPGDPESEALDLNNGREVVGWSGGPAGLRAVLWSAGSMHELGAVRGAQHSRARAINNQGRRSSASRAARTTAAHFSGPEAQACRTSTPSSRRAPGTCSSKPWRSTTKASSWPSGVITTTAITTTASTAAPHRSACSC